MKREVRTDVVAALKPHKVNWSNKPTLLNLSESLSDMETVTGIEYARHEKDSGYLALTDQRLLFVGMATSLSLAALRVSIPLPTVTSIDMRGRLLRSLYVSTAGQTHEFTGLGDDFAARIMNMPREAKIEHQTVGLPADQLLKLRQLLDAGVLTDGEYEAKAAPLKAML